MARPRSFSNVSVARETARKGGWNLVEVKGKSYKASRRPKPVVKKKVSKKKKVEVAKSIKVSGKQFNRLRISKNKANADKFAKSQRKTKNVRVRKVKGGYAVYARNK